MYLFERQDENFSGLFITVSMSVWCLASTLGALRKAIEKGRPF